MKAILITFDQAHYDNIVDNLQRLNCRGFSAWPIAAGRGSKDGEPHYGSHAWPALAQAIITIVEDSRVEAVLKRLHELDGDRQKLGLRAFVWNIEATI